MIGKWQVKNPLTIDERRKIKECVDLDMSYGQMGAYVGRPKSTVLREARRIGNPIEYDPEKAQQDFERKQREKRIKKA